ncbi:MAG: helicase-related protein, partial [Bacilli bacterium]
SWKVEAGNRKTIAFCPTIEDAERLNKCFVDAGIKSAVLHGKLKKKEREQLIHDFTYGNLQCLMSVAALIAGFDSPPCSCVIIKRPFLYKSTFIQAVGRGLRRCDINEFPDIYKSDCIVLDYTGASLKHGNLVSEFHLEGDSKKTGDATMKTCPVCESELFLAVRQCPFCGYEYQFDTKEEDFIHDFQMTEYDLINASMFKWFNLSADQNCMMCSHFEAWAIVVWIDGKWHGVANNKNGRLHYLTAGKKTTCIKACDDFLFATCKNSNGKGNKAWMNDVPTPLQISALGAKGINLRFINTGEKVYDYHKTTEYPNGRYIYKKIMITEEGLEVSKYSASLLLTMMNNKDKILKKIQENK